VVWRRGWIPGPPAELTTALVVRHAPKKKIAVQGVKFLAQHVGQALDDAFNSC
jgi:hypothetical protein